MLDDEPISTDDASSQDDVGSACEASSQEDHEGNRDQILTQSDIVAEIDIAVASLQPILDLDAGACFVLLQKFKWSQGSLLDAFYSNPDTNQFLMDQGVIPKGTVPYEDVECPVCCVEAPLIGLACNHSACKECWKQYVTEKVGSGEHVIECMDGACNLVLRKEDFKEILDDPSDLEALMAKSFVESNTSFSLCPSCGLAIKRARISTAVAICLCGAKFCFSCGNPDHTPISCHQLRQWIKACDNATQSLSSGWFSSDKGTSDWVLSNTKDCPKCLTTIEKSGGCNHIQCTNKWCKHQFCWRCLKSWHGFGTEPCFDVKPTNQRTDQQRFKFYFNRFKEHEQNLRLEKPLREKIDQRIKLMQTKFNMSYSDSQFLRRSLEVLTDCRRTLMYTYVFAYYLNETNFALMFENNQKDLEVATEQLSEFLEIDLDGEVLATLNEKVLDKCYYVEHRQRVLIEHCAEGDWHQRDLIAEGEVNEAPEVQENRFGINFSTQFYVTCVVGLVILVLAVRLNRFSDL